MGRKKILRLTAAQEKALEESVQSWLAIGYSTERCDREACEAAWTGLYAKLGEPKPVVIWLDSPIACIFAWSMLSQVGSQLGSQLHSQLHSQLYSQLDSQLHSQLHSQLYSQLRSQLHSQLSSQLYSQLHSQLRSQLHSQLHSQLYSQLDVRWGGGWWSWWPAFYSWPEMNLADEGFAYNADSSATLALWRQEAANAHWWLPYKSLILASDRPTILKVDSEGRFHGEDGPALRYADGYSLYAWHGVRLDDPRVIEQPEKLTVKEILAEANVEVRRVMIERFGYPRMLVESAAKPVDKDDYGKLWRIPMRDDEDIVVVEVVNSTPEPDGTFRDYMLRVPPTMQTAREAVAWTFDVSADEYRPAVQT